MPTRRDPPVFSCQSAAATQSLGMIRHRFARWLEHGGAEKADRRFRDDLVLALSELSYAALNASGAATDRVLEVRAWREPEAVVMEVVEAAHAVRDEPLALSVVASVTDTLTIRRDEGHLRLRARKQQPSESPGVVQPA
jgi:hypothetical protein